MATASLINTPIILDNAESTSDWNGDTFDLEPDIKVQGSNSISCAMTNNGNNDVYVDGFTAADLSTEHIRLWFNSAFVAYFSATNPIQVFISDGSNTAYWAIDASTYAGGWSQAVIYTGNTPTSGTKPTGNSTRVGLRFVTSSKPRNVPANAWFDAWTYGDGFTVTGGTSGDEIDWSHIAAEDKIEAYNIVSKVGGVYFLTGDIQIGNGTSTTYFKDEGQIGVFQDLPVLSSLYEVRFEGSGCNVVVNGGTLDADGVQDYKINSADTDMTFELIGKQIANASTSVFYAGQDVKGNIFNSCGAITHGGSNFENNTINKSGIITVNSSGTFSNNKLDEPSGVTGINSTNLDDLDDCIFLSDGTGHAVTLTSEITSNISMAWKCNDSSYASSNGSTGNETIKVNVASGITLTINVGTGKTTPTYYNTGTGTVNVVAGQISLTLTGLPDGIEVRIRQGSYTLQHTQNTSGGQIVYNYTYVSDEYVTISFTGAGIIQSKIIKITLGNTNQTSLVTFDNDPSYNA